MISLPRRVAGTEPVPEVARIGRNARGPARLLRGYPRAIGHPGPGSPGRSIFTGRRALLRSGSAALAILVVAACAAGPSPRPTYAPLAFLSVASMTQARSDHTATLLDDGRVLIAGGYDGHSASLASAEVFDPTSREFAPTGSMAQARYAHTATLLPDGRVLVVGGYVYGGPCLASVEIFDPVAGRFSPTGSLSRPRCFHTATRLGDGRILIAGGFDPALSARLATAEIFDPIKGIFEPHGQHGPRCVWTDGDLVA